MQSVSQLCLKVNISSVTKRSQGYQICILFTEPFVWKLDLWQFQRFSDGFSAGEKRIAECAEKYQRENG